MNDDRTETTLDLERYTEDSEHLVASIEDTTAVLDDLTDSMRRLRTEADSFGAAGNGETAGVTAANTRFDSTTVATDGGHSVR